MIGSSQGLGDLFHPPEAEIYLRARRCTVSDQSHLLGKRFSQPNSGCDGKPHHASDQGDVNVFLEVLRVVVEEAQDTPAAPRSKIPETTSSIGFFLEQSIPHLDGYPTLQVAFIIAILFHLTLGVIVGRRQT